MTRPPAFIVVALAALAATACINPADSSDELSVVLVAPGDLFLGDTVRLSAQVLDETGAPAANVGVRFTTSEALVASVDAEGLVRATGVGTATITASAIGYLDAAVAEVTVEVHALLEVDSVLPRSVRWGDLVTIYGAGLDPLTQRAQVTIGGVDARVAAYVPADTARRERFGQLTVWVPVPAPAASPVSVFARGGAALAPQGLAVGRRDRYEPNDTLPAPLGSVTDSFVNPSLAFEPAPRLLTGERGRGFDWYRWTNPQTRALTAIVRSDYPPDRYVPFFTDTAFTTGLSAAGGFVCNGVLDFFFTVERDSFIVALEGVPADAFWVLLPFDAPFTTAVPYELRLLPGYRSSIAPDTFEENDLCAGAPALPTGNANLSIDVVGDADWFQLTVPTGGRILNVGITAADSVADLDFWIFDATVTFYDAAFGFGPTESYSGFLPAGTYYILIADYPGVPTTYTMTTALTAPPAGAPPAMVRAVPPPDKAASRERARAAWERQRARLEAAGIRVPGPPRP